MPIVVTRDGLRTEEQLKDEEKRDGSTIYQCVCGKPLTFPKIPQQKVTNCPDCGFSWIW
jgi:hypothetical protein